MSYVPKSIFFYWGNKTMSWMRYMTLYSFRKMNPTWDMTLYKSINEIENKSWVTHETQDFFNFQGEDYTDEIEKLNIQIVEVETDKIRASHYSNFLKWSILAFGGGIYSDMDIIYFKSFDSFYEDIKNYDTVICHNKYFSIGLLASSGDNDFFKDVLENSFKRYNQNEYQSAGVLSIYDMFHDENLTYDENYEEAWPKVKAKYPNIKFYNIPVNLVYPYNHKHIDEAFTKELELPAESIGYHWYAAHPISQGFNNKLTIDNYKEFDILFTSIVKNMV